MNTFPFTTNSFVKDIVNGLPKSSDLFKRLRIDFCCGGNISLSEAARQIGQNPDSILEELKALFEKSNVQETDLEVWTNSDSSTIIDHVISHYHRATEEEFNMLGPYVTKVSKVHGDHHPELIKVHELFFALKKEMLDHLTKEEETVFPIIKKLEDGTIENREEAINLINELEKEHDHAGAILKELRQITNDFTPPSDACGTYRLVYKRLEELEGLTFMHVHLENNILFPRYY
ncbi:iron-sulfur cluster repair di-iron protein [Neobacillus thermocopriae]|uniref:Iron-sulfur cluster repair di-iron protein n=1 Tax=Neobacillus thermocopriae TaxID=1215031 RepID=A0A6B3TR08_9BACI|nr:iron-sulfur cluster repair di-iron protein [Neobacillus thermocopriae]NEX78846.1 iron-sulfur cluster repair di-iron protein [Neobacillus thermocopriae]